jgi:CBS domain-containing protein
VLFVREVMRTRVIAFEDGGTLDDARRTLKNGHPSRGQHLYPVIDADRRLSGVITRKDLAKSIDDRILMSDVARRDPVVAVADEPLRTVVYRMAETGFTRMPVVESGEERRLVGMISLDDLLHARARNLSEERSRERVLHIRLPFRGVRKTAPVRE